MASLSRSPLRARRKSLALAVATALVCGLAGSAGLAHANVAPGAEAPAPSPAPTFSVDDLDVSEIGDAPTLSPNVAIEQTLYLEVYFGERNTGRILQLQWRQGRLFAAAVDLQEIGIVVDPGLPRDNQGLLALDSLPGLQYQYDAAQQRLILSVPVSLRPQQALGYRLPAPTQATRGHGLLLNYDAYLRGIAGDQTLSVATMLRWFGRAGALDITGVSRAGTGAKGYQRLDTRWSYSDSRTMSTWTVGDLISGGLGWTRPVRLGGVQWRRNFGVRPDLITFPVPRISGQATVPSSVDLLVNNIQQYGGAVDDGPFVIDAFPRISGAGEATVIVRDALGRATETTVPIYVDYQRLAPGLSDFSLEAGRLRQNYATDQDRYGHDLAVSGSYRRGLTRTVTMEAHAEHAPNLRLAGVGLVWSPAARWGLVSAAYARSRGLGNGSQRTLGYQWTGPHFGFDAQAQRRDASYRDLGDVASPASAGTAMRAQDRATFWMAVPHGSASLTWLRTRGDAGGDDRIRSLSWSQVLAERLFVTGSLFDSARSGRGIGLTFSLPLGNRRDASLSLRHDGGRTEAVAGLRQTPAYDGGWGWDLQAGDRLGGYANAQAQYRGRYGDAMAGVDHSNGRTGYFGQASGSVAWMAGDVFPSRRIGDSFAVVSTNGTPGVPVLYENRLLGKTGAGGFLLLPDLRGWQRNKVAINPDGLSVNYRVPAVEQWPVPADQGGVLVTFDIAAVHPAWATLLDADGQPVAAGTGGLFAGTEHSFLVGLDGEAYLDDAAPGAVLELEAGGKRCRYRLPTQPAPASGVRQLGNITCEVTP